MLLSVLGWLIHMDIPYMAKLWRGKSFAVKVQSGHCRNFCDSQYACRLWACVLLLKSVARLGIPRHLPGHQFLLPYHQHHNIL